MPHSLIVIDDHPLVREGLGRVVSRNDDLSVVGDAASIDDALALDIDAVDLVLLDLALEGSSGLDGIGDIKRRWPDARVIMVTVHPESLYGEVAAERGAVGFINKSATTDEVRAAVLHVANGGTYFPGADGTASSAPRSDVKLSPRETEVLILLAEGHRVTDIAPRLGLSVKTVSAHKIRLQKKLGATNSAQLGVIAQNLGLLG